MQSTNNLIIKKLLS